MFKQEEAKQSRCMRGQTNNREDRAQSVCGCSGRSADKSIGLARFEKETTEDQWVFDFLIGLSRAQHFKFGDGKQLFDFACSVLGNGIQNRKVMGQALERFP